MPYQWLRNKKLNTLLSSLLILTQLTQCAAGQSEIRSTSMNDAQTAVSTSSSSTVASPQPQEGGSTAPGFTFNLSEGSETLQTVERPPLAETQPLDAADTQVLIDRLPPLTAEAGDVQAFRLPAETLKPPRPGITIAESFPPTDTVMAAGPVELTDGPVEVLRYAPEGEIRIAPFLQVTFNQPMVPLATLDQLKEEDVPVKITPAVPGVWKWLGTKTLVFEYKPADGGDPNVDRFPKATEYKVEIPAGTKSATGNELAEAVSWTFTTPPPVVQSTYPGSDPQPRNPLMFIGFDQRIDPAKMLEKIDVTASGKTYKLLLANEADITRNPQITRMTQWAGEGRWLAFKATDEFPADTTVNVSVLSGAPSAEGPLTTKETQGYSFYTYGPLRITDSGCSYGQECPPGSPFYINFNNSLDGQKFSPAQVTVSPTIPGLMIDNFGTSLQVRGATAGRTTYNVTVSGNLADIFGQTLGKDATLTFKTGSANPSLSGPNGGIVTVDPTAGTPTFTFYTINYDSLRVRAYAVTPDDWPAYLNFLANQYQENPPEPPGREVLNTTYAISGQKDMLTENALDLTKLLTGNKGHLILVIDNPPGLLDKVLGNRDYNKVQAWVQVTQIGLDAFNDHSELLAWTTALSNGAPLQGVKVRLNGTQISGETDQSGVAKFQLDSSISPLLVADLDGDIAILPQNIWDYYGGSGWTKQGLSDEIRWYVFDDRQMYRPAEEVHIKGWLRQIGAGQQGDVGLPQNVRSVHYLVMDPQGNTLADERTDVNALGGFDFAFTLPEGANLGYANINFDIDGIWYYNHSFQIQEFRRPEFEVAARNESTGPFFIGDSAVVAVSANYYSGGPLPGADASWNVNVSPSSYSPPNWDEFTFGKWVPWWFFGGFDDFRGTFPSSGSDMVSQGFAAKTDGGGEHFLRVTFDGRFDEKMTPQPYSVQADVSVMDVNRQAWASATNLLVHPAEVYVGLRSKRTFVERGTPLDVDLIVADVDGKAQEGREIRVSAARMEWQFSNGDYRKVEKDVQDCVITSALDPVTCSFTTDLGGEYQIKATVRDDRERLNYSEFTRWVSGGKTPAHRSVEREEATLIPDKETYQPGDTAEILVQSPFSPAEGLLTVARSGILYTERFQITDGTYTIKVPITDEHIPNLNIQVDLNGSAARTDENGDPLPNTPPRPAYAGGSLTLAIPPLSRTLKVETAPESARIAPGVETSITVTVTDAAGNPVADSEVALVAVDESVLALTGYQLADPIANFYSQRGADISSYYARSYIVLANPEVLAAMMSGGMGGGATGGEMMQAAAAPAAAAPMEESANARSMALDSMATATPEMSAKAAPGQPSTPIAVRSDFNPLAIFAPATRTDKDGIATVQFKLPDNLTRYRIMAVAVSEGKFFGKGEANLTARLPLMVRPSAPRFLNFGDAFQLPIVVQNQTDEAMEVSVAVRASNLAFGEVNAASAVTETLLSGKLITVPANDRVEVRFPATTISAGTARFQVAVASGEYADAATIDLPVYTPATTEAFAVYGVVDEGAIAQPVQKPSNVFPQFGGLEISTSSTAVQALTDAVLYLAAYPFECSEQISSRVLGIAALRDVLTAFKAEGLPSAEDLVASVARDVIRLQAMQNFDGGWPIWQRGRESVPYYSIHVAHALQRAKLKGFDVPPEVLQLALDHLRNIENYYPSYYSALTRHTLSSYAVYVRDLMGDTDTVKARTLLGQYPLDDQSLETIAWLWQVLSDDAASQAEVTAIRRQISNKVVETPGAANFTTSYGEEAYLLLHSDRRTDGIVLDALINDQPDSDLIPKVVNGLMAQRQAGRWNNTQENAFILLALDRYFNTFEAQTPDFVARIWLGDTYAGEHVYEGRTTEIRETKIPMEFLVGAGAADEQDLVLSKEGPGRLYYRLGLRYAPSDLNMPPLDMGFVVQRTYEAVDDAADVSRDEAGVWHIKAGARVRVRIKMVADNRRYNVALVDPLPAGLEIINPALAVSESVPRDPVSNAGNYGWWWYSTWYEHQNLRDQRAEAFTSLLWEGVYDYDYVARATTPGEFVVPPAKAEEMYSPEVFGRSGIDKVVVE